MEHARVTKHRLLCQKHRPLYVDIFEGCCFINGVHQEGMEDHEMQNELSRSNRSFLNYCFDILHDEMTDTLARVIYIIVQISILISILSTMFSTVPKFESYDDVFGSIEIVVTSIFTVEYLSRLVVARNKMSYALSLMNLLDVLAILPFYLKLVMGHMEIRSSSAWASQKSAVFFELCG